MIKKARENRAFFVGGYFAALAKVGVSFSASSGFCNRIVAYAVTLTNYMTGNNNE